MKKYIIALISLPLIFGFNYASGQQKEEKKVIIIKETKDKKTNKTTEQGLKSEDMEEEIQIKKSKEEEETSIIVEIDDNGNEVRKVEKRIEVRVDGADKHGSSRKIIIHIKGEDGKEKLIEWEGEGDVPNEIKDQMKEMEIHIEKEHLDTEKKIRIIERKDVGDSSVIELQDDGNIPDEVIEKLAEKGIQIKDGKIIQINREEENHDEVIILKGGSEEIESAKPILGVSIEPHVDGLEVQSVSEGTPAEQAGLVQGDIIYMVKKKHVGSPLQLISILNESKGETVKIKFLRDGNKKSVRIKL